MRFGNSDKKSSSLLTVCMTLVACMAVVQALSTETAADAEKKAQKEVAAKDSISPRYNGGMNTYDSLELLVPEIVNVPSVTSLSFIGKHLRNVWAEKRISGLTCYTWDRKGRDGDALAAAMSLNFYHIPYFRKAVYDYASNFRASNNLLGLQRVFASLQKSEDSDENLTFERCNPLELDFLGAANIENMSVDHHYQTAFMRSLGNVAYDEASSKSTLALLMKEIQVIDIDMNADNLGASVLNRDSIEPLKTIVSLQARRRDFTAPQKISMGYYLPADEERLNLPSLIPDDVHVLYSVMIYHVHARVYSTFIRHPLTSRWYFFKNGQYIEAAISDISKLSKSSMNGNTSYSVSMTFVRASYMEKLFPYVEPSNIPDRAYLRYSVPELVADEATHAANASAAGSKRDESAALAKEEKPAAEAASAGAKGGKKEAPTAATVAAVDDMAVATRETPKESPAAEKPAKEEEELLKK